MPQNEDVLIENAEIAFRNFTGREGMYNAEGDRSFVIILPRDIADDMVKSGWNIKTLKAREEGEEDRPYVQISVSYKNRPPTIVLITSRGRTMLDESALDALDNIDILTADVILRPYDWKLKTGASGRKAYLGSLYITVNENPLELKYGALPATVDGPMMEKTGPYVPSDEATH